MAHMVEEVNGKAALAYVGQVPWHGLGTEVPADLTPTQMLKAAGIDWEVEKIPAFAKIDGKQVRVGHSALVRKTDHRMLTVVTDDWNPVQNEEAFDFFHEFVMKGEMEMHTAGSLRNGQIVWGLAKVKETFEAVKGDVVESHLLFTNFHRFGFATDVRFTPIRVVCNNTLTASLNQTVERMVKISHRREFNPDDVKVMLGIAHEKMIKYGEGAKFLAGKLATKDQILEYFTTIFPMTTKDSKKTVSKNAQQAMDLMGNQPGSQYAPGSFWQLFNTVTYMTDHLVGKSADTRLNAAWYGYNKPLKIKALEKAVQMANAA